MGLFLIINGFVGFMVIMIFLLSIPLLFIAALLQTLIQRWNPDFEFPWFNTNGKGRY